MSQDKDKAVVRKLKESNAKVDEELDRKDAERKAKGEESPLDKIRRRTKG